MFGYDVGAGRTDSLFQSTLNSAQGLAFLPDGRLVAPGGTPVSLFLYSLSPTLRGTAFASGDVRLVGAGPASDTRCTQGDCLVAWVLKRERNTQNMTFDSLYKLLLSAGSVVASDRAVFAARDGEFVQGAWQEPRLLLTKTVGGTAAAPVASWAIRDMRANPPTITTVYGGTAACTLQPLCADAAALTALTEVPAAPGPQPWQQDAPASSSAPTQASSSSPPSPPPAAACKAEPRHAGSLAFTTTDPGRSVPVGLGFTTSVLDGQRGFAYFFGPTILSRPAGPTGSESYEGNVIVKVRIADFTETQRVNVDAGGGELPITHAVIDPTRNVAYAYAISLKRNAPYDPPAYVPTLLTIRLDTLTVTRRTASASLPLVLDPTGEFLYSVFGGKLLKLRVSDLSSVGEIPLLPEEAQILSGAIHDGFAYFGTYNGWIVKVRLSDFTKAGSAYVGAGTYKALAVDAERGVLLAGADAIQAVRMSDLSRIGVVNGTMGDYPRYAVNMVGSGVDQRTGHAFFASAKQTLVAVRLSDRGWAGNTTLPMGTAALPAHPGEQAEIATMVFDPATGSAFLGTTANPGRQVPARILKVETWGATCR